MNLTLTEALVEIKEENQDELRNEFIKEYFPFIIKKVSDFTGRYVDVNNSDEFSIALDAFNEAIDRYDFNKGKFLSYAKLVIESRLKDFYKKKKNKEYLRDSINESASDQKDIEREFILKNEILRLSGELEKYNISFDKLIDTLPKHQITKSNAIEVTKLIISDETILDLLIEKGNLPRKEIINKMNVTNKQLKRSRNFIIATTIVLSGDYETIREYLHID
ncbi:MAG: RNA polymerase subunit sigma [Bacillota bacterium]|nr:RNA polymerase subunit sigma [Bacillota bacterium]